MIRKKDILDLARRQPFQPFRIHLSDGSSHDVLHPEVLKVSTNTVLLFIPKTKFDFMEFDDCKTISILHITQLETRGEPGKARKQG